MMIALGHCDEGQIRLCFDDNFPSLFYIRVPFSSRSGLLVFIGRISLTALKSYVIRLIPVGFGICVGTYQTSV